MRQKLFVGLATSLFLLLAVGSAWAAQAPRDVVTELYRLAAGPKGDYGPPSPLDSKAGQALLTRSLRDALIKMFKVQKKTNQAILDFDPITDSQDPSVVDLKIEQETSGAHAAGVVASFARQGEKARTQVRYLLKQEDGAWKIDDILGGAETKWDLRAIIRHP
jgi:hypothetical protein